MLANNPQIRGISPWILKDFRAMLRPLSGIQDFYNRKGLMDENGNKKEAFYVLADFYQKNWNIEN
jgi:beta-glucuronidase